MKYLLNGEFGLSGFFVELVDDMTNSVEAPEYISEMTKCYAELWASWWSIMFDEEEGINDIFKLYKRQGELLVEALNKEAKEKNKDDIFVLDIDL